jgi:DNA-binding Xre family transcriptional regulator
LTAISPRSGVFLRRPQIIAALAAYYTAKAAFLAEGAAFPPDLSALLLTTKSRLAAIRKWRGFSKAELVTKAGIQQGYLTDLETKRRSGLAATIERLAAALEVPVAWFV